MKQDVEQLIKALHGIESTFWGETTQVWQDGKVILLKEYKTRKVDRTTEADGGRSCIGTQSGS